MIKKTFMSFCCLMFSYSGFSSILNYSKTESYIIKEIVVIIDDQSKFNLNNQFGKNMNTIPQLLLSFLVENSLNENVIVSKLNKKSFHLNNIIIPKYTQNNITSEIENYGFEIVRHFRFYNFFEMISSDVKNNEILTIYIK